MTHLLIVVYFRKEYAALNQIKNAEDAWNMALNSNF